MFPDLIEKLTRHEDLTADDAAAAMGEVMEGRATPAQIAGFLIDQLVRIQVCERGLHRSGGILIGRLSFGRGHPPLAVFLFQRDDLTGQ